MKFAWFTPLSERSAIGRASSYIVRELAKIAEVELWHYEKGPTHPVDCKQVYAPSADLSRLSAFDLVIYNLGNHLPFHGDIFNVARQHPGLVILHDYVMHHFFAALYLEQRKEPAAYLAEMELWYGAAGRAAAERSLAGHPVWETDDVIHFPLLARCTENSLGVIAHSDYLLAAVRRSYSGPIRKINLPYELPPPCSHSSRAELGVPSGALLLVTIGHVNPNKRVHVTLEALAPGMFLLIAGPSDPNYQKHLDRIIAQRGIAAQVHFLGRVSDEVLHSCLSAADICVNLRLPALEGASASVIEEMLYRKPVIVTDTGFYRELPSDTVVKIDPNLESTALPAAFARLAHPVERESLGARAHDYAVATFRADLYARDLLRFAWQVRHAQPIYNLSDRVAAELRRMKVSPNMPIVDTVAQTIARLFCS
jgi:glycosyltransferase involved in cell wall biosynthesis